MGLLLEALGLVARVVPKPLVRVMGLCAAAQLAARAEVAATAAMRGFRRRGHRCSLAPASASAAAGKLAVPGTAMGLHSRDAGAAIAMVGRGGYAWTEDAPSDMGRRLP